MRTLQVAIDRRPPKTAASPRNASARDFGAGGRGEPHRGLRRRRATLRAKMLTSLRTRNYNVLMKAKIIQIGNSRGIRLPRVLLEQAHLTEEVQLDATPNQIVIRSVHAPREGWETAFRLMAERDDEVLDEFTENDFDDEEWKW